jgi:hypothetical protein
MTKHTKPLSPETIRELNKRRELMRNVERLPENQYSRAMGCVGIILVLILITAIVGLVMLHTGG